MLKHQAVDNSRYMLFAISDKNKRMVDAVTNGHLPVTYHNHNGQDRNAVFYEYPESNARLL